MIIPYKPIINELVANRVDFNFDHAQKLYDASQVVNPSSNAQVLTLKPASADRDDAVLHFDLFPRR